jgi:hypothetical protein
MASDNALPESIHEAKDQVMKCLKKDYVPYYLQIERIIPGIPRLNFIPASLLVSAAIYSILITYA